MRSFNIYIGKYDWIVRVYVGKRCGDASEILHCLKSIGCNGKNIRDARKSLEGCVKNTGLTYSNVKDGISVLVVGVAESSSEFFDSLVHEIMHLSLHVCSSFGMDPYGEDVCYVGGDLARSIYPFVKDYLCDCCRKKILPS